MLSPLHHAVHQDIPRFPKNLLFDGIFGRGRFVLRDPANRNADEETNTVHPSNL